MGGRERVDKDKRKKEKIKLRVRKSDVLVKKEAGLIDATVTNRIEQHVCVWVESAGCLYAYLKIDSDSHTYRRSQ